LGNGLGGSSCGQHEENYSRFKTHVFFLGEAGDDVVTKPSSTAEQREDATGQRHELGALPCRARAHGWDDDKRRVPKIFQEQKHAKNLLIL
jgi:hypothetical protein